MLSTDYGTNNFNNFIKKVQNSKTIGDPHPGPIPMQEWIYGWWVDNMPPRKYILDLRMSRCPELQ